MGMSDVISILSVLISGVAGAVVLIMTTKHKHKQESEKDAINQWRELHELQQVQLDRQEKHIGKQDALIAELFASDADCQVQLAQQYGTIEWMHDALGRCANALKKNGMDDLGPLPALPPRPSRRGSMARTEFLTRQSAQDSANLAAINKDIKEQPAPGGK